jgi:hypothetical protein
MPAIDHAVLANQLAHAVELLLSESNVQEGVNARTAARVALEKWRISNGMGDPALAMPLPSVHMNGTSAGELIGAAMRAAATIRVAMERLPDASPHGRDYYPQGSGELARAEAWHRSRRLRLESVHGELMALAEGIDNGGYRRPL